MGQTIFVWRVNMVGYMKNGMASYGILMGMFMGISYSIF